MYERNRPDAARLCLAGASLSDRPKGFTREVEVDCTRAKLSFLQERQFDGAKAWAAYRAGSLVGYLEVLGEEKIWELAAFIKSIEQKAVSKP